MYNWCLKINKDIILNMRNMRQLAYIWNTNISQFKFYFSFPVAIILYGCEHLIFTILTYLIDTHEKNLYLKFCSRNIFCFIV